VCVRVCARAQPYTLNTHKLAHALARAHTHTHGQPRLGGPGWRCPPGPGSLDAARDYGAGEEGRQRGANAQASEGGPRATPNATELEELEEEFLRFDSYFAVWASEGGPQASRLTPRAPRAVLQAGLGLQVMRDPTRTSRLGGGAATQSAACSGSRAKRSCARDACIGHGGGAANSSSTCSILNAPCCGVFSPQGPIHPSILPRCFTPDARPQPFTSWEGSRRGPGWH
jgi:hypothetical protein